jgi:pSer/pThr/pTyr-binding forkhead associated (FHA) protein
MPAIVLDLLKYVFLIVLYIFVARAVRAVYLDLRGTPARAPRSAGQPSRPAPRKVKRTPRRVAVLEGESHKGKTFDLSDEFILGRSDKCHLVLDDAYVSTVHARIFSKGEIYVVEDMGSTNGTYLNRKRVTTPTEVQRGDRIKVGKTVLELRK